LRATSEAGAVKVIAPDGSKEREGGIKRTWLLLTGGIVQAEGPREFDAKVKGLEDEDSETL